MIDINVRPVQEHVTVVEVSGRIDSMNANELGAALTNTIDHGHIQIVLDLASVDYMSSAGLRELVTALKRVKKETGDMRLAQPSPRVREVLEMAGLDTIFRIFPTQSEAIGSY